MKRILPLLLFCCTLAGDARPNPYFRFLDTHHPRPMLGALNNVETMKKTDAALALPLITHSHNDGYIFLPGEDWTPLSVGVGGTAGNFLFSVGPGVNVLPPVQIVSLWLLDKADPSGERLQNLRSLLRPAADAPNDVSFSVGPQWVFKPWDGPHGHGYFRLWTGAAYQF